MDKNDFLAELKRHLTVLDDGEQNDILEEYSQHIGMKISSGLSEEEAIRDFGNIKELAAQILEAYHVNPQYRKKRQENVAEEGKKILHKITESTPGVCRSIKGFFKNCLAKLRLACAKLWRLAGAPFRWLKNKHKKEISYTSGIIKEQSASPVKKIPAAKKEVSSFFRSFGHMIAAAFRALWNCFLWCVRLAWNILMLFISLAVGLLTLALLFFFAVLIVLLVQGYPFAGLTILCLGGVICFGTLSILITTFIFRKRKDKAPSKDEEPTDAKEVRHA